MKLFKNPELKKEVAIYIYVTLVLSAICLRFAGKRTVPFVFAAGLVFCIIHIYFSEKRYKKIDELSTSIDRILHGSDALLDYDNSEGELAVLVSEVQKMTVRLREQNDLLKTDKIRLTDAIADIFHQMRTPLTSMNLELSLLAEEELDYSSRIQLVRELRKQLSRMTWLTESLLKMSKIDAGTAVFELVDILVKDVIKKAADPFLVPMELRGQTLDTDCREERFMVDPSWMAEALGNLIKNCMEHTADGGTIKISASETALFTKLTIEDDGEGFVKEDIPNLFERFYKGKNATPESIGIGLALTRSIIAAQNGTITADNTSKGARFTIKIYKSVI